MSKKLSLFQCSDCKAQLLCGYLCHKCGSCNAEDYVEAAQPAHPTVDGESMLQKLRVLVKALEVAQGHVPCALYADALKVAESLMLDASVAKPEPNNSTYGFVDAFAGSYGGYPAIDAF